MAGTVAKGAAGEGGRPLNFEIVFSPEAEDHLRTLKKNQQVAVLETIERQLCHQAIVETRNRKPMRPNPLATWELRIGKIRVYYEVEEEPSPTVHIRAVGIKVGNKVFIANEQVDL
jgi:mRNA-degrading endonuclease RelE of RelBE toxin-antitoxin system